MKMHSPIHTADRHPFRALVCSGLITGATVALFGFQAIAAPVPKPKPRSVEARVAALETEVATLTAAMRALQGTVNSQSEEIAGLKGTVTRQAGQIATLQDSLATQAGQIGGVQRAVASLQSSTATQGEQIASLTNLLEHFTRDGNEIYITGANLNIRNGLGSTWGSADWLNPVSNGLGNLVIGYNETDDYNGGQSHLGSHNLILGPYHSYPNVSGLAVGIRNTISGAYASVSGGGINAARGRSSSVLGGNWNSANGHGSSVSGGYGNVAGEWMSTVGGGRERTAPGEFNWVAGSLLEPY